MANLQDIWSKLVARAWVDPDFKSELVSSPKEILEENKYSVNPNEHFRVLENTENLMNIVIPLSGKEESGKHKELNQKWAAFSQDLKSKPELKQQLQAKPAETLKKYGIPTPLYPVKVFFETEKEKYLVLPIPPREELSESQLKRIFAGTEITNDFSTDTSCG